MRTLEMGRSAGVVAVAATMALAACGNSGSETSSQRSAKAQQTVTVLAAASLTESFKELAAEYEKAHPGTKVELSFAASSTIVQQLSHGAPADVVALADTASATKLPKGVAKGKQWRHFATNQLEIATPSGNPAHVTSLADLSKVGTVVCAKQVPCGRAADAALTKAHVTADVVSYERDVKATLAKITSKDADAGIVYATDVKAAGNKVTGVPIPAGQNVTTTLPIAVWSDSTTARGFVDLVMGAEGRKSLTEKGFGSPN